MTPHAEASVVSMTPLNTVRERRPSPLNESPRPAELLQLAHFIKAKVASHRDIGAQSKHVATSAKEDLERHQQWLEPADAAAPFGCAGKRQWSLFCFCPWSAQRGFKE